jgi:hypothetical protein
MLEPDPTSKFIVYALIVYVQVNTLSPVIFVRLLGFQPLKVYPVLVEIIGATAELPYCTVPVCSKVPS